MENKSTVLINKFSLAIDLSRNGQTETAHQIWEQLSEIEIGPDSELDRSEFITKANLYKAWTLMDLEQFQEAVTVFESKLLHSVLANQPGDTLYEYFFSYANALGETGDQKKMESAYLEAMKLAKDLGDPERMKNCWLNLLYYAELNSWWNYLEQASRTCIVFAESAEDPRLGLSAGIRRAKALASSGKIKRAEIQAKRIIQVAIQFKENKACDLAQEFLNELEAAFPREVKGDKV